MTFAEAKGDVCGNPLVAAAAVAALIFFCVPPLQEGFEPQRHEGHKGIAAAALNVFYLQQCNLREDSYCSSANKLAVICSIRDIKMPSGKRRIVALEQHIMEWGGKVVILDGILDHFVHT